MQLGNMPSLRSILLLALPLASTGFAQPADFQALVHDVPSESLRAALDKLGPKYREGVFEDHHDAMNAVHQDNPVLAVKLAEMARLDSIVNSELRRRQEDNSNSTTTTVAVIVTDSTTTAVSVTMVTSSE